MEIRSITTDEARPLRANILRPNRPFQDSCYTTDDDAETLHTGAFEQGELVCVATVFPEPLPGSTMTKAWRLRGMATRADMRRKGFGKAVLEKCINHIRERGGELLWCNARTDAIDFYRTLGFETLGGEQLTPHGTPFVRMQLGLTLPTETRLRANE